MNDTLFKDIVDIARTVRTIKVFRELRIEADDSNGLHFLNGQEFAYMSLDKRNSLTQSLHRAIQPVIDQYVDSLHEDIMSGLSDVQKRVQEDREYDAVF